MTRPSPSPDELTLYEGFVVRKVGSDVGTVDDVLRDRDHVPPFEIHPKVILDLGCNLGAVTAAYAEMYQEAQIVAVDLDRVNCWMTDQNTRRWRDRVTVVHGAVVGTHREVTYQLHAGGQNAYTLVRDGLWHGDCVSIQGITIDHIMRELSFDEIDLIKMDIEGAELEVLEEGGVWPGMTKMILLETHNHQKLNCRSHLEHMGFIVKDHPRHPEALIATRP